MRWLWCFVVFAAPVWPLFLNGESPSTWGAYMAPMGPPMGNEIDYVYMSSAVPASLVRYSVFLNRTDSLQLAITDPPVASVTKNDTSGIVFIVGMEATKVTVIRVLVYPLSLPPPSAIQISEHASISIETANNALAAPSVADGISRLYRLDERPVAIFVQDNCGSVASALMGPAGTLLLVCNAPNAQSPPFITIISSQSMNVLAMFKPQELMGRQVTATAYSWPKLFVGANSTNRFPACILSIDVTCTSQTMCGFGMLQLRHLTESEDYVRWLVHHEMLPILVAVSNRKPAANILSFDSLSLEMNSNDTLRTGEHTITAAQFVGDDLYASSSPGGVNATIIKISIPTSNATAGGPSPSPNPGSTRLVLNADEHTVMSMAVLRHSSEITVGVSVGKLITVKTAPTLSRLRMASTIAAVDGAQPCIDIPALPATVMCGSNSVPASVMLLSYAKPTMKIITTLLISASEGGIAFGVDVPRNNSVFFLTTTGRVLQVPYNAAFYTSFSLGVSYGTGGAAGIIKHHTLNILYTVGNTNAAVVHKVRLEPVWAVETSRSLPYLGATSVRADFNTQRIITNTNQFNGQSMYMLRMNDLGDACVIPNMGSGNQLNSVADPAGKYVYHGGLHSVTNCCNFQKVDIAACTATVSAPNSAGTYLDSGVMMPGQGIYAVYYNAANGGGLSTVAFLDPNTLQRNGSFSLRTRRSKLAVLNGGGGGSKLLAAGTDDALNVGYVALQQSEISAVYGVSIANGFATPDSTPSMRTALAGLCPEGVPMLFMYGNAQRVFVRLASDDLEMLRAVPSTYTIHFSSEYGIGTTKDVINFETGTVAPPRAIQTNATRRFSCVVDGFVNATTASCNLPPLMTPLNASTPTGIVYTVAVTLNGDSVVSRRNASVCFVAGPRAIPAEFPRAIISSNQQRFNVLLLTSSMFTMEMTTVMLHSDAVDNGTPVACADTRFVGMNEVSCLPPILHKNFIMQRFHAEVDIDPPGFSATVYNALTYDYLHFTSVSVSPLDLMLSNGGSAVTACAASLVLSASDYTIRNNMDTPSQTGLLRGWAGNAACTSAYYANTDLSCALCIVPPGSGSNIPLTVEVGGAYNVSSLMLNTTLLPTPVGQSVMALPLEGRVSYEKGNLISISPPQFTLNRTASDAMSDIEVTLSAAHIDGGVQLFVQQTPCIVTQSRTVGFFAIHKCYLNHSMLSAQLEQSNVTSVMHALSAIVVMGHLSGGVPDFVANEQLLSVNSMATVSTVLPTEGAVGSVITVLGDGFGVQPADFVGIRVGDSWCAPGERKSIQSATCTAPNITDIALRGTALPVTIVTTAGSFSSGTATFTYKRVLRIRAAISDDVIVSTPPSGVTGQDTFLLHPTPVLIIDESIPTSCTLSVIQNASDPAVSLIGQTTIQIANARASNVSQPVAWTGVGYKQISNDDGVILWSNSSSFRLRMTCVDEAGVSATADVPFTYIMPAVTALLQTTPLSSIRPAVLSEGFACVHISYPVAKPPAEELRNTIAATCSMILHANQQPFPATSKLVAALGLSSARTDISYAQGWSNNSEFRFEWCPAGLTAATFTLGASGWLETECSWTAGGQTIRMMPVSLQIVLPTLRWVDSLEIVLTPGPVTAGFNSTVVLPLSSTFQPPLDGSAFSTLLSCSLSIVESSGAALVSNIQMLAWQINSTAPHTSVSLSSRPFTLQGYTWAVQLSAVVACTDNRDVFLSIERPVRMAVIQLTPTTLPGSISRILANEAINVVFNISSTSNKSPTAVCKAVADSNMQLLPAISSRSVSVVIKPGISTQVTISHTVSYAPGTDFTVTVECSAWSTVYTMGNLSYTVRNLRAEWLTTPKNSFFPSDPSSTAGFFPLTTSPQIIFVDTSLNETVRVPDVSCSLVVSGNVSVSVLGPASHSWSNTADAVVITGNGISLSALTDNVLIKAQCTRAISAEQWVLPGISSVPIVPIARWLVAPSSTATTQRSMTSFSVIVEFPEDEIPANAQLADILPSIRCTASARALSNTSTTFIVPQTKTCDTNGTAVFDAVTISGAPNTLLEAFVSCWFSGVSTPAPASPVVLSGCSKGQQPSGSGRVVCVDCPEGFFSDGGEAECAPCPKTGATCLNGQMMLLPGFFRPPSQQNAAITSEAQLYECWNSEACTMAASGNSSTAVYGCAEGYTGALCGVCAEEDGFVMFSRACRLCWSQAVNVFATIGMFTLVFLFCLRFALPRKQGKSDVAVLLRLLLTFLQSLGALKSFRGGGMSSFREIMGWTDTVSDSATSFVPIQCLWAPSFSARLVVIILSPLIGAAVVLVIVLGLSFVQYLKSGAKRRQPHASQPAAADTVVQVGYLKEFFQQRRFTSAIVAIVSFAYMPIVSGSLRALDCLDDEIDGITYLRADMSIDCNDDAFQPTKVLAVAALIIMGAGFPCFIAGITLWAARKTPTFAQPVTTDKAAAAAPGSLYDPSFNRAFGALYDGYDIERRLMYWEALVVARKALLAIISVLVLQATQQAVIAGIVLLMCLWMHSWYKPYVKSEWNALEGQVLACLTVLAFLSALLDHSDVLSQQEVFAVTMVMMILTFSMLARIAAAIALAVFARGKTLFQRPANSNNRTNNDNSESATHNNNKGKPRDFIQSWDHSHGITTQFSNPLNHDQQTRGGGTPDDSVSLTKHTKSAESDTDASTRVQSLGLRRIFASPKRSTFGPQTQL